MNRLQLVSSALIIVFLIALFIYILQPFGENFYIFGDFTAILFSFLAVLFGIFTCRLHDFSSAKGKALFFFTTGIFFWFLGETTWGVYEVILRTETPVASVADVFWLIGYPMFLVGLYYLWSLVRWAVSKKRLYCIVVLLAIFSLTFTCLSVPTFTAAGISNEEKISTAGYVIGDVVLLDVLVITITYLSGKEFSKMWTMILLAIFIITIADVVYPYILDIYRTGNLIDLLWDLGYIIFALGFFYYWIKYREILNKADRLRIK